MPLAPLVLCVYARN